MTVTTFLLLSYMVHLSYSYSPKPDECPIREDYSGNRECQRKCETDTDCVNDRKLCLCDGDCGLSCIRPEKECPELPDPPHGQVHLTGRHFNDRAVYTCDDGYQIVGLDQVVCNSDGQWSGSQPACKQGTTRSQSPYYCGEPKVIPNAKHNGSNEQLFYDLDTELTYSCFPGYKRKGFQEAQCFFYNGTARWFGPDLSCLPIDCGDPEDILNGKRIGECTTYRCQITYACVPGFELVGKDTRYCQSDGTWTPNELPTCVPVQCGIPDHPANGQALFTAVAYKSVVSYKCKYGFMIVGDATRTCGEDKKWSGDEPECKEINCGSPGFLPNGWLEGSRTTLHAVVSFRCIDGMTFEGPSVRTTCTANGKWSHPVPKCYAPCIVPVIQMGKGSDVYIGDTLKHGENITVICDTNYELASNSTPIRCNNGTWTQIPKCEPARCKSLPSPPLNGMIVVPKTKHGGIGLYQCKDGFVLKGDNITRCNYGNWTGTTPACELIYCPFPGYIENGKVLLVGNMGLYDYRPYVRKVKNNRQIMFACDRGFKLANGPPGATCIDGRWSPSDLPTCVDEFHPKMTQWMVKKRKKRSTLTKNPIIRRSRKNIKSARKKELEYIRRHRRSKHESLNKTDCPPIEEDENLTIDILRAGKPEEELSESTTESDNLEVVGGMTFTRGTIIKANCSPGYVLNTSKKRIRCKRGEWKPVMPKCVSSGCRLPPRANEGGSWKDSVEGNILPSGGSIAFGKSVDLICDEGYFKNGPSQLECSKDGDWTTAPQLSVCVGNPCVLPDILNGGTYIGNGGNYRAGQKIPHNSYIDFKCPDIYSKKNLPDRAKCHLGKLLPEDPMCLMADPVEEIVESLEPTSYNTGEPFKKEFDSINVASIFTSSNTDVRHFLQSDSSCHRPDHVKGTKRVIYGVGDSRKSNMPNRFPEGTEVTFDCLNNETSWKIFCKNGQWIGRALSCAGEKISGGFNASCVFKPAMPGYKVTAFVGDKQLKKRTILGPETEILYRCVDIGKYVLRGSRKRRCIGGVWDGKSPVCEGLNQLYDYDINKPPTVLFRHRRGPIAQSNDGKLIVSPGTILHMECLFVRRNGSPEWTTGHMGGRNYPRGWTTDPGRDAQLEYRLSIYHARVSDTGSYTCTTPMNISHSIDIIVKEVRCPHIVTSPGLTLSTKETKMNTKVVFSCNNGNDLIGGPVEAVCYPSGSWSSVIPACLNITCPKIMNPNNSELIVRTSGIVDNKIYSGTKAYFSCTPGFYLEGTLSSEATCLRSGKWSIEPIPRCQPISCSSPENPESGFVNTGGKKFFHVGDMVKFRCKSGYMMEGQPVSRCNESGDWSNPAPTCVRACTYPGSVIGGTISDVKFFYKVGDTVSFKCSSERLVLKGAKMLECLGAGVWSSSVPNCSPPHTEKT